MSKNQNYYISVVAKGKLNNGDYATISGIVKLSPGCDEDWLNKQLSESIANSWGEKPNEIIITSVSQISRGLYNRLRNLEE